MHGYITQLHIDLVKEKQRWYRIITVQRGGPFFLFYSFSTDYLLWDLHILCWICLSFFFFFNKSKKLQVDCHSWENQSEGFRISLPVGGLGQMTFPCTQTLAHRYMCVHWPLEPLAGSDYKPRAYLASRSYQMRHTVWPNLLIHGLLLPW